MRLPTLWTHLSLASWLAGALCAPGADRGYLPLVGPPHIRFALPPVTATDPDSALRALPPLPILEPRAPGQSPADAQVQPSGGALTNLAAAETPLPSSESAAETTDSAFAGAGFLLPVLIAPNAADPATGAGLAPNGASLTPQMFMKYFTPGTNQTRTGFSIIAPVSFVPPEPIRFPSSSATFETTPPGKP